MRYDYGEMEGTHSYTVWGEKGLLLKGCTVPLHPRSDGNYADTGTTCLVVALSRVHCVTCVVKWFCFLLHLFQFEPVRVSSFSGLSTA